ncbi:RDD family protein [Roseateles sp.]|uniref:RDD family protein n=1 Tax=Roseateles sp. TaxID=1971397 RepID=UPI00286D013F|nr:RDD family protein [Roseateles sp.]
MPELAASAPKKFDPRAWVTPDDLNVAPSLLGLPLATPRQRLFAMAADLGLLALAIQMGNFWLLLAAGLALWLWLRQHRPEVFGQSRWLFGRKAVTGPRPWGWLWVAVFAIGGTVQAWHDAGEPPAALPVVSVALPADAASAASAASAAAAVPAVSEGFEFHDPQARRIERLEAQLERARAPLFYALHDEFRYWVDKIGLSYFWGALYFTLLPLLWPGQTPGKRLLGLQVMELTAKRLTPLILFKRFGGYAAGLATGGSGFVQLIWDSNRQAIQDKTAHTVVIDARSQARMSEPQRSDSL